MSDHCEPAEPTRKGDILGMMIKIQTPTIIKERRSSFCRIDVFSFFFKGTTSLVMVLHYVFGAHTRCNSARMDALS